MSHFSSDSLHHGDFLPIKAGSFFSALSAENWQHGQQLNLPGAAAHVC